MLDTQGQCSTTLQLYIQNKAWSSPVQPSLDSLLVLWDMTIVLANPATSTCAKHSTKPVCGACTVYMCASMLSACCQVTSVVWAEQQTTHCYSLFFSRPFICFRWPASPSGRSKLTVPSPRQYRHPCIVLDNSAFLPGLFRFIPPLPPLLQVWTEAASHKGADLTSEEKWSSGTQLIASLGDPVAAERVHREANNYYRLMRVLEVVLHTGKTMAEFEAEPDAPVDYDFRCVVVIALIGPWALACSTRHP